MKSKLLKFCRYYKGEKENPFPVSLRYWIWEFERRWVDDTLASAQSEEGTPFLSDSLSRYRVAGLEDFAVDDGVPLLLKATLYALFLKGNELPLNDEFRRFYGLWKNEELER